MAARRLAAAVPRAAATPRGGAIAWPLPSLPRRERRTKPTRERRTKPTRERRTKPTREPRTKPAGGLGHRIGAFVVSLPDHPWLDRLVRGRAWIPVLGVLLAGIVATQVEILKLGASMGRAIDQTTTLTGQNEQLRDSVATLSDDRRIERLASSMGMVLPPPGAVGYLPAGRGGDVSGALANIHAPDPSAFVSLTPQDGDGALVTGPGTSTLPPPPGAPVATTETGASTSSDAATAPATSTASSSATGSTTGTTTTTAAASTEPQTSAGAAQTEQAATTTQAPDTSSQAPTDAQQAPTDTGQAASGAPTDQTSPGPATGAAAIQPADPSQQSSGG